MYLVDEILQLRREISHLPDVLYKIGVLKIFSKFTDKLGKQSSGGVLTKKTMLLKGLQISQKNIFNGASFLKKLQTENLKLSEAPTRDVL